MQYTSTNNDPFGPFVADYDHHFFKLNNTNAAQNLHREWARRLRSDSSYDGTRTYSPQVGDSVVYIPRAHNETISKLGFTPPWRGWPRNASWPVVQCIIRNLRYRFPYKRCHGNTEMYVDRYCRKLRALCYFNSSLFSFLLKQAECFCYLDS